MKTNFVSLLECDLQLRIKVNTLFLTAVQGCDRGRFFTSHLHEGHLRRHGSALHEGDEVMCGRDVQPTVPDIGRRVVGWCRSQPKGRIAGVTDGDPGSCRHSCVSDRSLGSKSRRLGNGGDGSGVRSSADQRGGSTAALCARPRGTTASRVSISAICSKSPAPVEFGGMPK